MNDAGDYESIYDYPKYYDLLFGSDWKAECDFFEACFRKHAGMKVGSIFEPACGTGRLLFRMAKRGYAVSGNDLNPAAVDFCNSRFRRHGLPESAVVADMTDFRIRPKADAAFNTINSFRHLGTEQAAVDHLNCMAAALRKGGIYLVGIHLLPTKGPHTEEEAWTARRGNLQTNSYMWSKGIDRRRRMEKLGMILDVYTPTSHKQIVDHMEYRTYTSAQFQSLVDGIAGLEIAETYDFAYDTSKPIRIGPSTEDVVYVLKRV